MSDAPDPALEMRDWGLVDERERARLVVVAPHLDDAALGCSYVLAAHPGAHVVTVFAGGPAEYPRPPGRWDALCGFVDGDDVHAARRAEDAAAMEVLDATPIWLDLVEHAYLDRAEWLGGAQVVDELEATVRALEPTAVLAPFGLGNPDHDATHDACMLLRARMPEPAWFCYEDMGYKHIPGLLAWRIARLFRAGVWPTPAAMPLAVDHERKMRAVRCYPSQLLGLEAEWQVGAKLEAPAPEQLWRLAPPPPGWEGLSAAG